MDNNLLTIELKNVNSIPFVKYKGEDITGRVSVNFNWRTSDADDDGYCDIKLEYHSHNHGEPITVDVKHSRKDYVKLEQKLVNKGNTPNMFKPIDINDL